MTQEVSLFSVVAVLLRRRRLFSAVCGVVVIAALLYALSRPRLFSSTFTFVPEAPQSGTRGSLASLAGQFGVSLGVSGGQAQSPQFYADLLVTRALLAPILLDTVVTDSLSAQRMQLLDYLEIDGGSRAESIERGLLAMRGNVLSSSVAIRTTGVVSVRVRTRSSVVSKQVADRLLAALNDFNLKTRQSDAAEERRFTEARLAASTAALDSAERALQQFLRANRQYDRTSELTFDHDRLQRAVSLRQQVVSGLAQQLEEVRIREVRDTPVLTVIEHPVIAATADPRGRVVIMIVGGLIAVFAAVLTCLVVEYLSRASANKSPGFEELSKEWRSTTHAPASPDLNT
jgi:uncharacterized protein involved in exopolysaccharide biosynthesis